MRSRRKFIDPAVLRQHLNYCPETGAFTRKTASLISPVGYRFRRSAPDQYCTVSFAGQSVKAHRAAWVWMTGEQPDVIDHINHIRNDNRWCNLRNVSQSENIRNSARFVRSSKLDRR